MFLRKSIGLAAVLAVFTACGETPTNAPLEADLLAPAADKGNHGKIVFTDGADIWVMNADGSSKTNLTPGGPGLDDTPSWSRNGRQIVFVSDRNNPGRPGPGGPPDFDPGLGGPQHEVYVMDADGSDVRQVTSTDQRDQYPHLSPNGKQIVFTRDLEQIHVPQLFMVNIDGTGETNLTNNTTLDCFQPAGPPPTWTATEGCSFEAWPRWSPNGKQILFNSAPLPGDADIWVMNADGTGRRNVSNSPDKTRNDFFASWSPNGKQIAFGAGVGWIIPGFSPDDIYVVNVDGSDLRQVTTNPGPGRNIAPVWSPNGKQLAFFTLGGGPPTIYSINLDGSGQTSLAIGAGVPHWASGPLH